MATRKILVGEIVDGIPVHQFVEIGDELAPPSGAAIAIQAIELTPISGMVSTDLQGAFEEIDGKIVAHANNIENPHGVTPGQIGAAVSGHNHTGTYEPANSNIQTHVGVTNGNPHGTTAAQVGAAESGHNHTGIYAPIGATTYVGTTAVALNRASGALALTGISSIDGSSASCTGNAANVTGVVAIANGGTGQTTAALARNALGLGNTTGAVPVANGGTGATTLTGLVKGNGTSAFSAASAGSDYAAASHSLTSSHTVSGLTTGHFLKATGTSAFGFAAHGLTATDVGAVSADVMEWTQTLYNTTGWHRFGVFEWPANYAWQAQAASAIVSIDYSSVLNIGCGNILLNFRVTKYSSSPLGSIMAFHKASYYSPNLTTYAIDKIRILYNGGTTAYLEANFYTQSTYSGFSINVRISTSKVLSTHFSLINPVTQTSSIPGGFSNIAELTMSNGIISA